MRELLWLCRTRGEEGIEALLGVGPDFDFPFKGLILFSLCLLLTEGQW